MITDADRARLTISIAGIRDDLSTQPAPDPTEKALKKPIPKAERGETLPRAWDSPPYTSDTDMDIVSTRMLTKLIMTYRHLVETRKADLAAISSEFGPTDHAVRYYVEPHCQHHNPADWDEDEGFTSSIKAPVFQFLNQFLAKDGPERDGRHQLFVLSDAGMGKTTLLIMLRLMYLKRFWPTNLHCELMKLGPALEERIQRLKDPGNTILLLDALDEDPEAYGRVEERIADLLRTTSHFRKVVITCRTQYFPNGTKDPFDNVGRIRFGSYVCPTIFLSWFDSDDVDAYLKKRFKGDGHKIEVARRAVNGMKSLRFRPLLLSYIEELMSSKTPAEGWDAYAIFTALVRTWLDREVRKLATRSINANADDLLFACAYIASRFQQQGVRSMTPDEFGPMQKNIPALAHLPSIDVGGRSLLNRTSEGAFRFSHYSIQEYLFARSIDLGIVPETTTLFRQTEIIALMMKGIKCQSRDFRQYDFQKSTFEGLDFRDSNFASVRMSNVSFIGCNLQRCDFKTARLSGVRFHGSDVRGCDFTQADLRDSHFDDCNVESAVVSEKQLADAYVRRPIGNWFFG